MATKSRMQLRPSRLGLSVVYAALPTRMLSLDDCGPAYGTLDAGAHAVRGHFHAIDVFGEVV